MVITVPNSLTSKSRWSKDLFISPSKRLALAAIVVMWWENLSWSSNRIPRSLWDSTLSIIIHNYTKRVGTIWLPLKLHVRKLSTKGLLTMSIVSVCWQLNFNIVKCKHIHIGPVFDYRSYYLNGVTIDHSEVRGGHHYFSHDEISLYHLQT